MSHEAGNMLLQTHTTMSPNNHALSLAASHATRYRSHVRQNAAWVCVWGVCVGCVCVVCGVCVWGVCVCVCECARRVRAVRAARAR